MCKDLVIKWADKSQICNGYSCKGVHNEPNNYNTILFSSGKTVDLIKKKYPSSADHLLNSCKMAPKKIATDNIRKN